MSHDISPKPAGRMRGRPFAKGRSGIPEAGDGVPETVDACCRSAARGRIRPGRNLPSRPVGLQPIRELLLQICCRYSHRQQSMQFMIAGSENRQRRLG